MSAVLLRASALRERCPRCSAKAGAPCVSVVGSKRGGYVKRWVHNARKRVAS